MAWTELANLRGAQGDPGPVGPQGPQGVKGDPGAATVDDIGGATAVGKSLLKAADEAAARAAIGAPAPLTGRGVISEAASFNRGDLIHYRGMRVMVTDQITGVTGVNPWISATKYAILSGEGAVVSAYDFGVRATGSDTDAGTNQAALIKAIDYASALGGATVQLPAGNIRFNGNLALKQGVTLRGAGVLATILQAAQGSNYDYLVGNEVASSSGGKNAMWCTIRDLMLDGRRSNQTAGTGHGIRLVTNPLTTKATQDSWFDPHHLLHNVWVYMVRGNGVHLEGRSALQAQSVFMSQCDGWGLRSTFDTNLSHMEADSCKMGGFHFPSGSVRAANLKAFLSGSGVAGSASPGFEFTGNAYSVILTACEAQNNTGPGFVVSGKGITLAGCAAESNWKDPVADGPGPAGPGFVLAGATNCVVLGSSTQGTQGGVLIGNQQHAVSFDAGTKGCSVDVSHTPLYAATVGDAVVGPVDLLENSVTVNGRVAYIPGLGDEEPADPALPRGWSPAGRGMVSWSFDPAVMTGTETIQVGRIYFARVTTAVVRPISKLGINVKTAAGGATVEMGIYDATSKTLLGSGPVDVSSTGLKYATLPAPVLPDALGREYLLTVLVTAGPAPTLAKCSTNVGDLNLGLDANTFVLGQAGSGLTASPATLGALGWSGGAALWMVAA